MCSVNESADIYSGRYKQLLVRMVDYSKWKDIEVSYMHVFCSLCHKILYE